IMSMTESGLYNKWYEQHTPNSSACIYPPTKITQTASISLTHIWFSQIRELSSFLKLANHKAKWHKVCKDNYNQTKSIRLKKQQADDSISDITPEGVAKRIRRSHESVNESAKCFFCDEYGKPGQLHQATTYRLDWRVRSAALCVGDTKLLAKSSAGDVIVIERKYHLKCLISLCNLAKVINYKKSAEDQENDLHSSKAFAELKLFVEEHSDKENHIIKLADLLKIYGKRQNQLGAEQRERIHSIRLKDKLLAHIPALQAHKKGRDFLPVHDTIVGKNLMKLLREMLLVWQKQLRYYIGICLTKSHVLKVLFLLTAKRNLFLQCFLLLYACYWRV
ncbi:putative iGluR-like protein, partial [Homarus americanus]